MIFQSRRVCLIAPRQTRQYDQLQRQDPLTTPLLTRHKT